MDEKTTRISQISKKNIPPPYNIQINVTLKCNLKCEFCWQRAYDKNREGYNFKYELSEERLLSLVDEAGELGVKEIVISGNGEPMCRADVVLKMMQKAKNYGMFGTLTTNGTLFTEKIVKEMVKIGWDRINVSLQAPINELQDKIRGLSGSLNKNINLFNWLKKWKIHYNIDKPILAFAPVVYSSNYKYIFDIFKFAKKHGVILCYI